MSEIFKINLEPNIDYENTNFDQIKQKLKNWRLNITEEIKCLIFIKNKIELKEDINNDDNDQNGIIDEKILEKYTKIFNKLEELCIQEINLISETIVTIDERSNNLNDNLNGEDANDDYIFDKIKLTLNNYNKIIDNINKTISSLPYILNLYMLYNTIDEEENKYIRENINEEEEKFRTEDKKMKSNNKINISKIKNKSTNRIKTINSKSDLSATKRERMVTFSKSVKNKKFKKLNLDNKNLNKININKIKIENNNKRENLKETILEIEAARDELKEYIYKNCIKENELKNIMKMKEDNAMLNEEIINIKNSIRELKNLYEYQLEKLECLKSEQSILEKDNIQLIGYINKILFNEEEKLNNDKNINNNNYNNDYILQGNTNISSGETINQNINNNSISENNIINITPSNFESIEMFKRLNKL